MNVGDTQLTKILSENMIFTVNVLSFIEELLNNFSREKDAWKHCLYFLSSTQNEYVMMYCMTVLEVRISTSCLLYRTP